MPATQLNYRNIPDERNFMADIEPPASLQDFAASNPDNRRRCLLCTVPPEIERQAREGKEAGITYRVIGQWLESIVNDGTTIAKGRLERHFQDGHLRND